MPDHHSGHPLIFRWSIILLGILSLGALLSGLVISPTQADFSTQGTESYCLGCHANPDLTMTLPSGEVVSLSISPEKLTDSTHSQLGIESHACHT